MKIFTHPYFLIPLGVILEVLLFSLGAALLSAESEAHLLAGNLLLWVWFLGNFTLLYKLSPKFFKNTI